MMVRCDFAWTGHPGYDDNGKLLTLHGSMQNTPASCVKVLVDRQAPHTTTVEGEVAERTFKSSQLCDRDFIDGHSRQSLFSPAQDVVTNTADNDIEYQVLYHSNFGRPILEKGSRVTAAASEVSPFSAYAKMELKDRQVYLGRTKGYDERVFDLKPLGDQSGSSLAVLHNKKGFPWA